MPRAKRGFKARRRRNRLLKWAKGYRGKRKNCHAIANESVQHAWMHMYRSRKVKKRDFRSLWIQRINAAAREHGLTYGQFIAGLKASGSTLDRKSLSELAISSPAAFARLAKTAADARPAPKTTAADAHVARAYGRSWVTMSTVLPYSFTRRWISSITSSALLRSRSPVGSSATSR